MACGITVAPNMPTARTALSTPFSRGTSPARACAGSGGEATNPARKPAVTIASIPVITRSKVRCRRLFCSKSNPVETAVAVLSAPVTSGRPKSRLSATAPPTISARSVATATSSAWAQ